MATIILPDDSYRDFQHTLAALNQSGTTARAAVGSLTPLLRTAKQIGDFALTPRREAELLVERDLLRVRLESAELLLKQEQYKKEQTEGQLAKAKSYEGAYYALKRACFLFLQLPNTRPEERFDWRQFEADGWSKN